MMISQNLNSEFRAARSAASLDTLRQGAAAAGPYSYLAPDLVRQPSVGNYPMPRRLSHTVTAGQSSKDYSYLTGVEKRAIMKYAGRIQYTEPEMMGPLFDPINWFLPYTFKVLNRWIRYYDRFEPWIGNAIDMHAEVPLSRFTLTGIDDVSIQREYEEVVDELDLYQRLLEITREYWLLGEVFPFAHWNDGWLAFDQLAILNPDYVTVNASPLVHGQMVQFEMEPDDATIAIVKSNEPRDLEIRDLLDPVVIEAVESGTNIPLDPFSVSHVARKASPYDLRGTSIILRCLKDLLYEDKLREAQMAIADRLITPLQVFRLGDPKGDWLPDQGQIDEMASLLAQGRDDPNFALVGHFGLQVEYIGATGKVLPVVPEFNFVRDRILAALFTNKAMMEGTGPTYANASVAFEILQLRYMALRGLLEVFVQQKIFRPMAEARQYYTPLTRAEQEHGIRPSRYERTLTIPNINWLEKIRLLDDVQMKRFILQLRMKMDVPLKTVCDIFDLDYVDVKRTLAQELGTVADPVWRQAVSKSIAGDWTTPGTPGKAPGGGGAPGAGGGGAGGGGMPGAAPEFGGGMPGEMAPGAMGPIPREVSPEGGTTPGGPELPGAQPEEIGPGAGSGIAAGMKFVSLDEAAAAFHLKEELERKREEALKQIEEAAALNGDGKIPRKVFGQSKSKSQQGVQRRGDSFYVVDR